MRMKRIKLTEDQFNKLVSKCVKRALTEMSFKKRQEMNADWEELEKSSRGDKNENITDKVVEIEDYNGNTIMAFETNKYGKIMNYDNCDIADIDSDYIFNTDKDLMRIQVREEN